MTDNGGSNAIRGFNYQKAIISLIAILNFPKDNLEIFLENKEDVEVILNGSHTFLQVKGSQLSLNKVLKRDGPSKKSILGKLLSHSNKNVRYKIVTPEHFAEKDKKNLVETADNLIFDKLYEYSNSQKSKIAAELEKEGHTQQEISSKLEKNYLYLSPFKNDAQNASTMLLGHMSTQSICVDNNKGIIALNELFTQIDQRSEIRYTENTALNINKKLTSDHLKTIFSTANTEKLKEKILNKISVELNWTVLEIEKIRKEGISILTLHKTLKHNIVEKLGSFHVEGQKESDLLMDLDKKVEELEANRNVRYAILIDLIAEKIQEDLA